jgi:23S rRNA (uracil1939-C5)-methyltransferase
MSLDAYRRYKEEKLTKIFETGLKTQPLHRDPSVFLGDGTRRRAALTFASVKGKLTLGFNTAESHNIANIDRCAMLTPALNDALPDLRAFLERLTRLTVTQKGKGGKKEQVRILSGDILLLEADNGLDLVLKADKPLGLEHRLEIFDYMNAGPTLIRFSHQRTDDSAPEPIVEKIKPIVRIGGYDVFVAAGMFLQASKSGEDTLTNIVRRYVGDTAGVVADLFCGIGTFSYVLAPVADTVDAYDLSAGLLNGFEESVKKQMLHHINVKRQNLFKYPLEETELKAYDTIVLDPPRAGASAQIARIAALREEKHPRKIVYVSCNPHSFVNDANVLTDAGWCLENVTFVDQFVYSAHGELVALFTK